jgi:Mce-associated membrane protein
MAEDAVTSAGELSESMTDRTELAPPLPAISPNESSESPQLVVDADSDKVRREGEIDEVDHDELEDGGEARDTDQAEDNALVGLTRRRVQNERLALVVALTAVLAVAGLVGSLSLRAYQLHNLRAERQLFLQVGRQGAVNLTTIDYQHADGDVKRILDSATGEFYDSFSQRSKPFIDVVKKLQSKSVGTVTAAGLESQAGDQAQILVAVTVKTSNLDAAEQAPRAWRMRLTVQKMGDEAKVSNVVFVA